MTADETEQAIGHTVTRAYEDAMDAAFRTIDHAIQRNGWDEAKVREVIESHTGWEAAEFWDEWSAS